MRCPICGNEIPDNSTYCGYCGNVSFSQQPQYQEQYNNYQQPQGNYTQQPYPGQQPIPEYRPMQQPMQQPQGKPPKKKSIVPVLVAVAVVLALAIVGVIISFKLKEKNVKEQTTTGPVADSGNTEEKTTAVAVTEDDTRETPDEPLPETLAVDALDRPTLIKTGGAMNIVPSVDAYTVKKDLSDLVNPEAVMYLQDDMKKQLSSDYFLIVEGGYNEAFELYESNRYTYYANFITVDSMMHTYHLYFSHLLKNTERNYLTENLKNMTVAMLNASKEQYAQLKGTEWEKAAYTNVAFFAVAARCYNPKAKIPTEVEDIAKQECDLINKAEGIAMSPLLGAEEDYSQYKPRGYYTESKDLEKYFRTMMWYGRRNFAQSDDDLNKSALLMTIAMNDACLSDWEAIYSVTTFFAGASDDSGYYEYMPVIEAAYGKGVTVADLVENQQAWDTYKDMTSKLEPPKINSVPIKQSDSDEEAMEKILGYRFMGQRFSLDESIFQRLVYRSVKENSKGQKRMLPSALDLPAALGSDTAMGILEEKGATDFENYTENMSQIRDEIQNADETTWNTSLYSNWLYTLTPLLEERGEGYPMFMQSENWQIKDLTTFLGSYAELKHDTILYSKQMMAEMGGGDIPVLDDRGYVEPELELYMRLANLVECTMSGLEGYGYLSKTDKNNLSILLELANKCATISEKELQNQTLSDDEYELIRTFGGQLEHFWQEVNKDIEGVTVLSTQEFPGAIIADVATDPNGSCLEVGTGRFATMYVIVPIDGKPHVCSGPVYTFYEFEQPISDRLTDEEWRKQLGIFNRNDGTWGSLVDLPDWEDAIVAKYEY